LANSTHARRKGNRSGRSNAIERLRQKPQLASLFIHKPGPLVDESPARQAALTDVYSRGLNELAALLASVRTKPS